MSSRFWFFVWLKIESFSINLSDHLWGELFIATNIIIFGMYKKNPFIVSNALMLCVCTVLCATEAITSLEHSVLSIALLAFCLASWGFFRRPAIESSQSDTGGPQTMEELNTPVQVPESWVQSALDFFSPPDNHTLHRNQKKLSVRLQQTRLHVHKLQEKVAKLEGILNVPGLSPSSSMEDLNA